MNPIEILCWDENNAVDARKPKIIMSWELLHMGNRLKRVMSEASEKLERFIGNHKGQRVLNKILTFRLNNFAYIYFILHH